MDKRTVIAVDAMGGDFFPTNPIKGALLALKELPDGFDIVLVGETATITAELDRHRVAYPHQRERIQIVHADEVITADEKPTDAWQQKKGSSLHVGLRLVKSGQADAFVSAGNTGALMAISLLTLGRIKGVRRPALVATFPTKLIRPCILLDVGANADCKPDHIAQFAVMGSVYAESVLGIEHPTVGLMSIGSESGKGSELTVSAHELLEGMASAQTINFTGNVEGGDTFSGKTAVIVCDGHTGNVLLKEAEGFLPTLAAVLKNAVSQGAWLQKIFAWLAVKVFLTPTIGALKRALDYERYGGAPLLGVDGIVVKAHGRSTETAFRYAISFALQSVRSGINTKIAACLLKPGGTMKDLRDATP